MKYLFATFLFLLCTSVAQSATNGDTFTVGQQIGIDTNPPTAPTVLLTTPVAWSQIDLSWNASIDDVSLGGYQVFRDAVQIATTTLTTYSDSGLLASTSYSYHVTAFDTAFNISSSSNISATTTLGQTPTTTPVTDVRTGGSAPDVKLISFDLESSIHGAVVSWETDRYAQFELRWGRSSSYELGFVTNELFKREHTTAITDLQPGTTFEYQLIAYDRDGDRFILSEGRFKTDDVPDTLAPTNVSDLAASLEGNNIVLRWLLPNDPDLAYVRIVRSHLFYPIDPNDGFIAYQDIGNLFVDRNAGSKNMPLYYTIFSYDQTGNVSSGATVAVYPRGQEPKDEGVPEGENSLLLTFDDLEVIQYKAVLTSAPLSSGAPFLLRIAYDKVPEHLKTILVTLRHPTIPSRTFTFLMRINKDKTFYEASIGPLREIGVYPALITVYDHQTQRMHAVEGMLEVVQGSEYQEGGFLVPVRFLPLSWQEYIRVLIDAPQILLIPSLLLLSIVVVAYIAFTSRKNKK